MYPSKQKPYAGVFVVNQYNILKTYDDLNVELFTMKRSYTNKVGSLLKYFKLAFRFLPKLFRSYDIIHLHYFFPLITFAYLYKLLHPSTRLVVTFHGSDIGSNLNNKGVLKIFKFFSNTIDYTISVGHELSETITAKLGLKVDKILCAGIDQDVFYHIEGVEKIYDFIFVGSFTHLKGLDILCNVIQRLDSKNIAICFVGSGPLQSKIYNLRDLRTVDVFENQTQEQLRLLYNRAKFMVLPSRREAFGLVATESLFCGTPIIVSKNGGLKEQVVENETGFIATTPNELLEVLTMSLNMTEKEYNLMVTNAKEANKSYSLKEVGEQLHEIYHILAKQ